MLAIVLVLLSPMSEEQRCTENPLILVTDVNHTSRRDYTYLGKGSQKSRPLIIVAEEVADQALSALIVNSVRGTLKIAAINAPNYGEERRAAMSDLAVSVGATFVTRESGKKLQDVTMADFGTAKSVESTKRSTVFVGGNADYERIDVLVDQFKS